MIQLNTLAVAQQAPMLRAILEQLPAGSYIGGGFIRDLLLNKPTRDIDIFVEDGVVNDALLATLGAMFDGEFVKVSEGEPYVTAADRTSFIMGLYRLSAEVDTDNMESLDGNTEQVKGISLDLIEVSEPESHFNEFPDTISRVRFTANGLEFGEGFSEAVGSGFVPYDMGAGPERLLKLQAKFPELVFGETTAQYA